MTAFSRSRFSRISFISCDPDTYRETWGRYREIQGDIGEIWGRCRGDTLLGDDGHVRGGVAHLVRARARARARAGARAGARARARVRARVDAVPIGLGPGLTRCL